MPEFLFFPFILLPVAAAMAGPGPDPSMKDVNALILDRYREILLQETLPPGEEIGADLAGLSAGGTWPDIDYRDNSSASWKPILHLERLRTLSLAYVNQQQDFYHDQRLLKAIKLGLDNWLDKRYQCPTWWYNEIGVPRHMRDLAVLLKHELDQQRFQGMLEVVGQFKVGGTAANLVWTAELALHYSCLTGDAVKATAFARRIWEEVEVGAPAGIQEDWSFFQHGPRLQSFHYGKSFLENVVKMAWQARGTPLAIPESKREILSHFILEGDQWMCRGIHTAPGTLDRAISRKGALDGADLREVLRLWREVDGDRQAELDAFLERQNGAGEPLVGFRHFPMADFTVFHRPKASFFLKTVSDRTRLTESINLENLKGVPYLDCGDLYIVRNGSEYGMLQPLWDWSRLPGLTIVAVPTLPEREPFVGGVGDGRGGITAMDYVRQSGDGGRLAIRKSWFFHEDAVICLIGGITSEGLPTPISTSLEQCRLQGSVFARAQGQGGIIELKSGGHDLDQLAWIIHNGIGYLPLGTAQLHLSMEKRDDCWQSINHSYAGGPSVSDWTMQVVLEPAMAGTSHGYALVLDATPDKLDSLARNPGWTVLSNNHEVQAVRFQDAAMAAFYSGDTPIREETFRVDHPCLAMWNAADLWICDPTHQGGSVSVNWNGRSFQLHLPKNGIATHEQARL